MNSPRGDVTNADGASPQHTRRPPTRTPQPKNLPKLSALNRPPSSSRQRLPPAAEALHPPIATQPAHRRPISHAATRTPHPTPQGRQPAPGHRWSGRPVAPAGSAQVAARQHPAPAGRVAPRRRPADRGSQPPGRWSSCTPRPTTPTRPPQRVPRHDSARPDHRSRHDATTSQAPTPASWSASPASQIPPLPCWVALA